MKVFSEKMMNETTEEKVTRQAEYFKPDAKLTAEENKSRIAAMMSLLSGQSPIPGENDNVKFKNGVIVNDAC